MYVIEILRYGDANLGKFLFGVYDDLDKAVNDARKYNWYRGYKYPKIVVNEFDLNKEMPFEHKSYIIDLEKDIIDDKRDLYVPLNIKEYEVYGLEWAMKAMRLPKGTKGDTKEEIVGCNDLGLASNLVKAGDDHAKAVRGIVVWLEMELQVGFMIEFETYRHGVECLSSSSSMHSELKKLKGKELAEQKQADLAEKVYSRILTISYQALRHMYKARRHHRHPDWQIFCDFIENLPYADKLITV